MMRVSKGSAQAAGDDQRFAGDPRRVPGGQEDSGGRDVLRLADAAEGGLRLELFAEVALREAAGWTPSVSTIPGLMEFTRPQ